MCVCLWISIQKNQSTNQTKQPANCIGWSYHCAVAVCVRTMCVVLSIIFFFLLIVCLSFLFSVDLKVIRGGIIIIET